MDWGWGRQWSTFHGCIYWRNVRSTFIIGGATIDCTCWRGVIVGCGWTYCAASCWVNALSHVDIIPNCGRWLVGMLLVWWLSEGLKWKKNILNSIIMVLWSYFAIPSKMWGSGRPSKFGAISIAWCISDINKYRLVVEGGGVLLHPTFGHTSIIFNRMPFLD